ncbi:MAG: glycosyltransferase [Syntrophobacterales bacterium]|nr:MAG: glycosyltransferase [Syntrophobacterales bacterium]
MNKLLKTVQRCFDCTLALPAALGCLLFFLFSLPWVFKQRRAWIQSARGNPKALIIQGFNIEKLKSRGYDFLLPFRNPAIRWMGFFDPVNSRDEDIQVADNLFVLIRRMPTAIHFLAQMGFKATATIFRECYAVYKIIPYCVKERIGILRAYKHNFPALEAFLVSCLIEIPFIVDIAGNYELIRRLTGKPYYFRTLSKIPIARIMAPPLANWLLGLPLKHAIFVLGRNKNNYEHAFALGAPVERLSLLRISNFNPVYNNYDPAHLPARPLEFPYLLFVGRLAMIKYPLDVIDAFDRAAADLPEHRLVIIGDGSLRADVERRIESSRFKGRILFLGACSTDVVFNWTVHARIAVCPFSGSTLAEAMLCGVPVVAYDIENHSEIVIDHYSGYLVPFRDIAQLSHAIVGAARDDTQSRAVAMRGRELARVAFDKIRILEKESLYYHQALK